jgi:hypothetical protein
MRRDSNPQPFDRGSNSITIDRAEAQSFGVLGYILVLMNDRKLSIYTAEVKTNI